MHHMAKYLRATPTIDCDNEAIRKKAQDLTDSQEETIGRAKSLFYFVRDEIKYNPYVPTNLIEYYPASRTLEREEGFCIQKAVLLAALARATGIPARLRFADIVNHLIPDKLLELMTTNLFPYHGYDELHLEGKWIKATPTFNLKMCQANRIIPVEFDGKNHAILHSHDRDGRLHIEYIQDHGHYEDLPLSKILHASALAQGSDYPERFAQSAEAWRAQK